jgi:hypothetical protein
VDTQPQGATAAELERQDKRRVTELLKESQALLEQFGDNQLASAAIATALGIGNKCKNGQCLIFTEQTSGVSPTNNWLCLLRTALALSTNSSVSFVLGAEVRFGCRAGRAASR